MVLALSYDEILTNSLIRTEKIDIHNKMNSRKIYTKNIKKFEKFLKNFDQIYNNENSTFFVLDFRHLNYISVYIYLQYISPLHYLKRLKIIGLNQKNLYH